MRSIKTVIAFLIGVSLLTVIPDVAIFAGKANLAATHWAFEALTRPAVPDVKNSNWIRTDIDRFVLHKLREKQLIPAAQASRQVLVRRVYFDLIGMPPHPDQIDAFVNDTSPTAYESLVDRLLASPHFGERWGRHWLDVARYADSSGYENDADRPNAYHYRDFVIKAFNEDLPFDLFAKWQLAGDQFAPEDPQAVAATGFMAVAPVARTTPTDTKWNIMKVRYDELDNILSTSGSAFLALTVGCARCHDHKYDPIPIRDYYEMLTAFIPTTRVVSYLSKPHRELDLWTKDQKKLFRLGKLDPLDATEDEKAWLRVEQRNPAESKAAYRKWGEAIEFTDEQWRDGLTEEKRHKLEALEAAVVLKNDSLERKPALALMALDRDEGPGTNRILVRGEVNSPGDKVSFGFLDVLARGKSSSDYLRKVASLSGSSEPHFRAALAEWMTDVDHGAGALMAQVIVNRLWQHHFGVGLVKTTNDFGTQGETPTHPELLDWLACELIQGGWRLKPIHRMILTSGVYRQASAADVAKAAKDPGNELLWRRKPLRLEVEAMRDTLLAVSGRLNLRMFGPGIKPPIPAMAIATRSSDSWPKNIKEGPEHWRRSIYIFVKRSVRLPLMETFDAPDPSMSCGRRVQTTVPTQALALLNDEFVRACARSFAERVNETSPEDEQLRIDTAWQLSLGRHPQSNELAAAEQFLAQTRRDKGVSALDAWTDLCQMLLTLNEFVYID